MADAPRYSRRVSFNERLYLAADRLKPGFCIQIVVEGVGLVPQDALAQAVARAAEANPGARLLLRGRLGFMRWVAIGPLPPVRRVEWPGGDGTAPEGLERPLQPGSGPTCEVVVAPGPTTHRLVFRCFHGVMDARGLLHFAEEVFRALRGEALVGADSQLNDTEFIESKVGHRTRPAITSDRRTITGARSARHSPVLWRRLALSGPAPALAARIATGLARHATRFHATPTRVMIPVDLRHYDREIRTTGNLTYPLLLDVPATQRWRDLQRDILKRLIGKDPMRLDPGERIVPWLPLWLLTAVYALWTGHHRRTGRFPFAALVTHLNLPDLSAVGGGGFRADALFFLPPQSDFIPLTVSAVSTPHATQVVVSAPSGLIDAAGLADLCAVLSASVRGDP